MQVVERLQRPARHRHFGADDIDRSFTACPLDRRLGDFSKFGRARGDRFIGKHGWIVGAGHARIQMHLGEAGARIGIDHRRSLLHRGGGSHVLPRVRSEMIAAEDQAIDRETRFVRMRLDKAAEAGRRHAGVAAVVVDLVAGGLDQHIRAPRRAMAQGSLDDQRMRRADRGDAAFLACGAPRRNVRKPSRRVTHCVFPVAMKASTASSGKMPSIGPLRVTASAPQALAIRSASAGAAPRSQNETKAAPKQSPAPVGSTSSTAKPDEATAP